MPAITSREAERMILRLLDASDAHAYSAASGYGIDIAAEEFQAAREALRVALVRGGKP